MKFQNGESLIKWQNKKVKHIKRTEYNCHVPYLEHVFPYVKNSG